MTDLHERFHNDFDDLPVPDLWDRIERLAETEIETVSPRRSRVLVAVAAAVAVLVLVGGPLLLLATVSQNDSVADTTTTLPAPQALTEVDPPWGETISAVTHLGDSGVVALASNPDRVFWSPDWVEWFDADPNQRVTLPDRSSIEPQFEDRLIVSADGQVAVRSAANDGVWIAAPDAGQWRFVVSPDGEGGDGVERVLTLAANDSDVLVVTKTTSQGTVVPTHPEAPESIPYIHEYAVWLIDTNDGTTERHSLPLRASEWVETPTAIANWLDGQWFIAMHRTVWTDTDDGWETSTPVMTSTDGRSWTLTESNFPPDSATSISAGPTGMIATECNFGGDSFWYSDDGVNWEVTTTDHLGHRSVYVDGLGFLTFYKGSATAYSPDGREWKSMAAAGVAVNSFDSNDDPSPAAGNLFFADNRLMQWSNGEQSDANEGTG